MTRVEAAAISAATGARWMSASGDFLGREALAAYHKHPLHAQTRIIVDPLVTDHWIADYDL